MRPDLDVRFKLYKPEEFKAEGMQMRTVGRMKQDPNAGLMTSRDTVFPCDL